MLLTTPSIAAIFLASAAASPVADADAVVLVASPPVPLLDPED